MSESGAAPAFGPDYPNAASLKYRDAFKAACAVDLPPQVLSWAIDRALARGIPAERAGRTLYVVYMRISARPKHALEAIDRWLPYLLEVFSQELEK